MKYTVLAVFFLLGVCCNSQDPAQTQNLTKNQDVVKQSLTKPESLGSNGTTTTSTSSTPNVPENVPAAKQNSPKDAAKSQPSQVKDTNTEPPVIINDSTIPLPGTDVPESSTTPEPITTTTIKTTSTTTASTTTMPTTTTPTTPGSTTNASTTTTTGTTSTTAKSTVSTTSKPPPTGGPNSTPAPAHQRGFDGPSFIGGIVLALGLVAIGFVAFKFYKARTELNYHTL